MTPFEQYLRLLLELSALMREEEVGIEGIEGDILRDQMDDPWYSLTNEERDRVAVISELLYRLDKIPSYEDLQKYLVLL